MLQKCTYGLILLTGILFSASHGVQIDLCMNSSGIISHISKEKFVHQWLLVGKKCETPGSVLLLNLVSTNLTCQKGDMSLGISAFGGIPNLCSFRRGGCFVISSSANSSFGCQREMIIQRDNVLPVSIALSKTASEDGRGFEIQYQLLTRRGDNSTIRSSSEETTTTKPVMPPTTTAASTTFSVRQSSAMSTPQELSALHSHAVRSAIVYLSLTIAFGVLLIVSVLLVAVLTLRTSRSNGKETKAELPKNC